jgi:predicted ribosomally synthesized peptide with nif11-like leader
MGFDLKRKEVKLFMSLEHAETFVNKFTKDSEFKKALDVSQSKEGRKTILENAGLSFTKDELLQLRGKLTENDLDLVYSGKSGSWNSSWCSQPLPA